jgi:FkbM family methyltransferase
MRLGSLELPSLDRPEYLLRPRSVVRRVRVPFASSGHGREIRVTPTWALPVTVRTDEAIGYAIAVTGVFDLTLTETLLRLIDHGDTAVDVGANVGYMTSVMAASVGPTGRVLAFEPNPHLVRLLAETTRRWEVGCDVELRPAAVSSREGMATLTIPRGAKNDGLAHLGMPDAEDVERCDVQCVTLDSVLGSAPVGVMKIDVEGHEAAVLEGADELLRGHRVRDVVFEDHGEHPTVAFRLLTDAGYTVHALRRTFWGPRLDEPQRPSAGWEGPSFLATLEPERAVERLRQRGWRALGRM